MTIIEEAKDLNTIFLDDLISSLIDYKHKFQMIEWKKKNIAFKSSIIKSDDEKEREDIEKAKTFITKRFKSYSRNNMNLGRK